MLVVSDLDSVTRIARYEPSKFALAQSRWLRPHNSMEAKKLWRAKILCVVMHIDEHVPKFHFFGSTGAFCRKTSTFYPTGSLIRLHTIYAPHIPLANMFVKFVVRDVTYNI